MTECHINCIFEDMLAVSHNTFYSSQCPLGYIYLDPWWLGKSAMRSTSDPGRAVVTFCQGSANCPTQTIASRIKANPKVPAAVWTFTSELASPRKFFFIWCLANVCKPSMLPEAQTFLESGGTYWRLFKWFSLWFAAVWMLGTFIWLMQKFNSISGQTLKMPRLLLSYTVYWQSWIRHRKGHPMKLIDLGHNSITLGQCVVNLESN